MDECESGEQLTKMLRSHVERMLLAIWEKSDLITDDDGDYPFRTRTAMGWVSLVGGEQPAVRVWANAAFDVPLSKKMLIEVTELNARSRWSKVTWSNESVVVEQAIHWLSVDQPAIERALESVSVVSDDIGAMLAAVYGGRTPFPSTTESYDDEDAA